MTHSNVVPADEATRRELERLRAFHKQEIQTEAFLNVEEIINGDISVLRSKVKVLAKALANLPKCASVSDGEVYADVAHSIAAELEELKKKLSAIVHAGTRLN